AMLHTSLLNVWEEAGWGWLPAVPFLCHNAGRVVFTEGSLSKFTVAQFGADCSEPPMKPFRPEGAAVLAHELVDIELSVLAAQEADRNRLPKCFFPNSLPDVTPVDVNLSTLGEVEVFGSSVAVVADEFYICST
ncbi:MAG: hypothetical protein AB2556_15730, partial [Candidatus Thiodiazotropha sp.]